MWLNTSQTRTNFRLLSSGRRHRQPPIAPQWCPRINQLHTQPFDEISSIDNLNEFIIITKRLKSFIFQIRSNIETANTTIFRHNGQYPIGLWMKFSYSNWSKPFIGNGFLPFTAKVKSAMHPRTLSEQIRMRACTIEHQFLILKSINQNPIGRQMTISLSLILPFQGVIKINCIKRLSCGKMLNNSE